MDRERRLSCPAVLVARNDTAVPDASVKDSFADLDLAESGFQAEQ